MIVVATADFELYHDLVGALRDRDVAFTTVELDDPMPADASVAITGDGEELEGATEVPRVVARPGRAREAVDRALAHLVDTTGRRIVGIDPGGRPGIAVTDGDVVVSAYHLPEEHTAETVRRELEDADDPLIRIGDGARLVSARLVEAFDDLPVELVDETGSTPYLGAGARGMGDVLAAVNIARRSGVRVEERPIEPTDGELRRIKRRSRERSEHNRAIPDRLARAVAQGNLTLEEALAAHDDGP